jgi:hypothetical protein
LVARVAGLEEVVLNGVRVVAAAYASARVHLVDAGALRVVAVLLDETVVGADGEQAAERVVRVVVDDGRAGRGFGLARDASGGVAGDVAFGGKQLGGVGYV